MIPDEMGGVLLPGDGIRLYDSASKRVCVRSFFREGLVAVNEVGCKREGAVIVYDRCQRKVWRDGPVQEKG
jgi:hypothetical protein